MKGIWGLPRVPEDKPQSNGEMERDNEKIWK